MARHGPMRIGCLSRLNPKTPIQFRQKLLFQKIVGLLKVADPSQAQFLDQPILQLPIAPFYPAFGLGRIGQLDGDSQPLHRPPKLGQGLLSSQLFATVGSRSVR